MIQEELLENMNRKITETGELILEYLEKKSAKDGYDNISFNVRHCNYVESIYMILAQKNRGNIYVAKRQIPINKIQKWTEVHVLKVVNDDPRVLTPYSLEHVTLTFDAQFMLDRVYWELVNELGQKDPGSKTITKGEP